MSTACLVRGRYTRLLVRRRAPCTYPQAVFRSRAALRGSAGGRARPLPGCWDGPGLLAPYFGESDVTRSVGLFIRVLIVKSFSFRVGDSTPAAQRQRSHVVVPLTSLLSAAKQGETKQLLRPTASLPHCHVAAAFSSGGAAGCGGGRGSIPAHAAAAPRAPKAPLPPYSLTLLALMLLPLAQAPSSPNNFCH